MHTVLIVGATSAVAQEVAHLYAKRGARLHLIGRSAAKLEALREALRRHPNLPAVSMGLGDFTELSNNQRLVDDAITALGHIDVVVIAHGLLGDQRSTERDVAAAEEVIRTNFMGVVSFVIPLANHLEHRGCGHLAVLSSVAGERGRPRNYTYGASKGAVTLYLQGVRSRLWPNVGVHTIRLGPVDSPMTADHPKNVLFTTCQRAARDTVRAIDRNADDVYVPWYWSPIMLAVRHMPESLFQRFSFLSGR